MITKNLKQEGKETLTSWGISLDDEAWEKLDAYGAAVLEFNKKTNITGAKTPEELFRRHLIDSLSPLAALGERPAESILDVGCGGGFVGICLKIALPKSRVTLLESVYRKVGFLNLATAQLGLTGIEVRHGRAVEDKGSWQPLGSGGGQGPPETPSPFDLVTARALAPLTEARRLTEPFVKEGGVAMIFQSDPLEGSFSYRLPGEEKDRHLALFKKERP